MTGSIPDCFRIAGHHAAVTLVGMSEVTRLLEAANAGDRKAAADLLPLVYDELRRLAAARMASESPGHTRVPARSRRVRLAAFVATRCSHRHADPPQHD